MQLMEKDEFTIPAVSDRLSNFGNWTVTLKVNGVDLLSLVDTMVERSLANADALC